VGCLRHLAGKGTRLKQKKKKESKGECQRVNNINTQLAPLLVENAIFIALSVFSFI